MSASAGAPRAGTGQSARSPRAVLFLAVAAAHLLAIWLLLRNPYPPRDAAGDVALAIFDVALPPPPPLSPPPPSVSRPMPVRAAGAPRGGSPGIRREPAAIRTERIAPPAREAIDATPAPLMPPALALPAAGSALVDLGRGGAGGIGSGTGSGNGDGDGRGDGGTSDTFARAEWIEKPSRRAYARYWPIGRSLPPHAVTVSVVCRVRRNGSPYRCRSRSEHPRGAGFQRMVLGAVIESKVRPVSRNGDPMWDVPVIITVVLDRLMTAPPITAAASAPPSPARP